MSFLCRLVSRATTSILYVSRMNAHNLPPGTPVKLPEVKEGYHIVSGSGQFIATDGPSATPRTGIGGGSSASMLPGAQSAHTAKRSGQSRDSNKEHQSHSKSSTGQLAAVALVSFYAGYEMLTDQNTNFHDQSTCLTRRDLQADDVEFTLRK